MKIIITENTLEKVKNIIKRQGMNNTIQLMGGFDTFRKVLNINSYEDYLHLFDDLEEVQSEEKEHWTLFRYEKGNNLMIYDRISKEVYINYDEIWSFLKDKFDLTYPVVQAVTKKWLGEVYNLRGITTKNKKLYDCKRLGEVYNLK